MINIYDMEKHLFSGKKILHLTLIKKWFDLIAIGEKPVEFREIKDHWTSRLVQKGGFKKFDFVKFVNGYGDDYPYIVADHRGTDTDGTAYRDPQVYRIHITPLYVGNWPCRCINCKERVGGSCLCMFSPPTHKDKEFCTRCPVVGRCDVYNFYLRR